MLISYVFPPTGGSAVQRPAKLARDLPACGWETDVLTAGHTRFPWRDDSLLADVTGCCRVDRVTGHEPACLARSIAGLFSWTPWSRRIEDGLHWRLSMFLQRLGIGDPNELWVRPAARCALRRHAQGPYDAVISSGPPHFVHRVALRIARRTGIPWVADIRDPLISDFDRSPATARRTRSMTRLEEAVMRHAAMVITTCPSLADDFRRRYPLRSSESIQCITNGFDRRDLHAATDLSKTEDCVFVAAGAFYGRREIARIVSPLRQVLDAHPEWSGRVRLVIAGTLDAQQHRRWEQDRPAWLTLAGYVDHASAVRLAAGAACTIVIVPQCRHGEMSIPGKTFELLALPTHLLAMVPPEGDTARIVRAAGAATVTAFEDQANAAAVMERIISDHFAGRLIGHRDWPAIDHYDRVRLAADFAACLDRLSGCQAAAAGGFAMPSAEDEASKIRTDNSRPGAASEAVACSARPSLNVSI